MSPPQNVSTYRTRRSIDYPSHLFSFPRTLNSHHFHAFSPAILTSHISSTSSITNSHAKDQLSKVERCIYNQEEGNQNHIAFLNVVKLSRTYPYHDSLWTSSHTSLVFTFSTLFTSPHRHLCPSSCNSKNNHIHIHFLLSITMHSLIITVSTYPPIALRDKEFQIVTQPFKLVHPRPPFYIILQFIVPFFFNLSSSFKQTIQFNRRFHGQSCVYHISFSSQTFVSPQRNRNLYFSSTYIFSLPSRTHHFFLPRRAVFYYVVFTPFHPVLPSLVNVATVSIHPAYTHPSHLTPS